VQRPADRDVVDVVTGRLRERAVLPPAGDAPIDQSRVARQARIGAEPQPLGDAGAEAFDEDVGLLHQRQHELDRLRALEIEPDRAPAAPHDVELVLERQTQVARLEPVDAQHVGAHVGEQHAAEWPRPDAGQLDHLHPGQRTTHCRNSIVRNIAPSDRPTTVSAPSAANRCFIVAEIRASERSTKSLRFTPAGVIYRSSACRWTRGRRGL
jgi:hypothetical protein